jgi:2,3,4,5-tetrahydropyridine-2,6-dicarboxylate N-succinyltransferase
MKNKQLLIEKTWENRSLLNDMETQDVIREVIALLDLGRLRIAEPIDGAWKINEWIKKAVMLYFFIQKSEVFEMGPFTYYDKIAVKKDFDKLQVRVVPQAIARYGSYLGPGVVLMPSYVNIGAYVDRDTFIDTWSTIGSCAQVGKNVHISGGVGIGGVLEPVQALPVIIEDHCFIGSKCMVQEGVHLEKEVIVGARTVLTKATKIVDVSKIEPMEYRGFIPARSVVVPGVEPTKFPAGEYYTPIALIVGKRNESIDKKASLDAAIKKYSVVV